MNRLVFAAGFVGLTTMLNAQETPVTLETKSGSLVGTLLVPPNASGPLTVALIIAGSGPTDRDGNTTILPGKNNSLKLVAEALAKYGVASVRYDKRGIAGSAAAGPKESDLRFTTYVGDAAEWLEWLRKDTRFSRRVVVGHSEGSLIGILAAQRSPVSLVVSLAGGGRPIGDVLDEQLSRALPAPLLADARRIMGELKAGKTVDSVPPPLAAVFRPSVQPYMISWLPIDPAEEAGRLTVPVLVVQGTTDSQVGVVDAERLAKGNSRATLELVDGMNHVLKEVREPSKQAASYSDPTLPLHPKLVELLSRVAVQPQR